jgi:hypothetical protein
MRTGSRENCARIANGFSLLILNCHKRVKL